MISFLPAVNASAAALTAERTRMEVTSQNIANANTTRGADGRPYQRQAVVFQSALAEATGASLSGPRSEVVKDMRPARMIYNPGHPDADSQGMVATPNINIHEEMADMIAASRAYEANVAVIKNSRMLALQALSIGKR